MIKRATCFSIIFLSLAVAASAQNKRRKKNEPPAIPAVVVPAANPNAVNKPVTSGPKPYSQVITEKAGTQQGLFTVHQVDERYFFEIPDSLLEQDILIVNRIAKAAADTRVMMLGYAGDQIGENVVRFEKGPTNKLFLRNISFQERASDTTGMYRSVLNSNLQPLVASFEIKAFHTDSASKKRSTVIDVTDYLNSDNDIFFFDNSIKKALSLAQLQTDRSYISSVRSFAPNIEIRTVKTYGRAAATPGGIAGSPLSYELNSSMVLLPAIPMRARYFDPRVGYFATGYVDYDANPQGVKKISMVTRWRLEPKAEDIEKYKKGELVEPKKPIVFYIDPATPRKWVPYLIQGVNDWQAAFEQAGFKNAIIAKEAPRDSSWSIDDASHNAIVYKPSDVPNASGPHVHDPRTGEILETHINWYHNVMSLVHNWYFIQAAAIDPRARKMQFDDELMGQLVRFVSSHEVGHTLGLRHNFGSSSTVPVENLRNKQWVEANGHTPSIMDYARFNYVAQPEDDISEKGIFPRIGVYDKWAIEWGYRWDPEKLTRSQEDSMSNKMIVDRLAMNKYLWFGTETERFDPRDQNEDLGNDAMLAGSYGIKNLKRILPNLSAWSRSANNGYEDANTLYSELVGQYTRYMGHAAKNIGGVYDTPKTVEQPGAVFQAVPFNIQKSAISFLNRQLFATPYWLVNKQLSGLTGANPVTMIGRSQQTILGRLLSTETFSNLISAEVTGVAKVYRITDLMNDLRSGIWGELGTHKIIDVYRRNLQKAYISELEDFLKPNEISPGARMFPQVIDPSKTDIPSISRAELFRLRGMIRRAEPAFTGISKYHLQDLSARITSVLDDRKN